MTHIDLFSGLGGLALAIDEVWENVEHIFCEINPFCQQIIKKHWEGATIYGDIRQLTAGSYYRGQKKQEQQTAGDKQCGREVFLLTGGFPCQPFSQAGKRKGTEDNRYLWPEMLRVIQAFEPTWVIAENVRGILSIEGGMVFEQVCLDLEAAGYEVQTFIIPAVAKNAPHRRDRVWIVANRTSKRSHIRKCDRKERQVLSDKGIAEENKSERTRRECGAGKISANVADTKSTKCEQPRKTWPGGGGSTNDSWQQNWLEVATSLCRVDDGFSVEMDGFKLTKAGHRVERLKALGNAIVPQVAIELLKAIKSIRNPAPKKEKP